MIRFSKYLWVYAVISFAVIATGMYHLVRFGMRQSIDFTGGSRIEVKTTSSVAPRDFASVLETLQVTTETVLRSGEETYILQMKPRTEAQMASITATLSTSSIIPMTVIRQETVGPVLGKELVYKATIAAILAVCAILLYVAYAFKNVKYGVSAVIALVHDLLVMVGSFAIFGHFFGVEIDTLFVTAFLTTMSFSVHDTIVVFDRIREYRKKDHSHSFEETADRALTETMNRSITNSLTIIFMLLALALMGGESIKWFVVALLVGTISGTYSSPFVATPVLIIWNRLEDRKRKK